MKKILKKIEKKLKKKWKKNENFIEGFSVPYLLTRLRIESSHLWLDNNQACCVFRCVMTLFIIDMTCRVDIGSWTNVTELNFGTNQLAVLPDDIGLLENLEVLILSNNALGVTRPQKLKKFLPDWSRTNVSYFSLSTFQVQSEIFKSCACWTWRRTGWRLCRSKSVRLSTSNSWS